MHENQTSESNHWSNWQIGGLAIFLGLVAWFVLILVSPPRLTGGDLICFMDPGVNLVNGEGLVERLSPANDSLQPKFYANYPPLYPALYGGYVSIVGLGAKTNEIFNFCLGAAATILFWFYITPRRTQENHRLLLFGSIVLTITLLPVGPFWIGPCRPDALGFIVMLASLFCLRLGGQARFVFLAALLAGSNSLISPFAFVMNSLALGWILLNDNPTSHSPVESAKKRWLKLLGVSAVGIAIPLASLFLIQWLNDPGAIGRFVNNATGKTTHGTAGMGYFFNLAKGDYKTYFSAFSRYDSISYKWRLAHLIFVTLLALVLLSRNFARQTVARSGLQSLAVLSLAGFPLLVFPYQPDYMSMAAGMIPVLFAAFVPRMDARRLWIIVASLGFLALLAVPFTLREFIIAHQAQGSYARMERVVTDLRPAAGQPPLVVATSSSDYFFFKQKGFVVVDISAIPPGSNAFPGIDLFVLSHNGEKIGAPRRYPVWWDAGLMEPVYLPNLELKTELFGRPVYNHIASWEADIYRLKQ